ncbi:hypothetical protein Dimus_030109 [Dionaea muscipula]
MSDLCLSSHLSLISKDTRQWTPTLIFCFRTYPNYIVVSLANYSLWSYRTSVDVHLLYFDLKFPFFELCLHFWRLSDDIGQVEFDCKKRAGLSACSAPCNRIWRWIKKKR